MLRVGLVGAGIQASRSPALHAGEARAQGVDLEYRLLDMDVLGVGVEALPQLVERMRREGFRGFNVTYPCKQAVLPLLDGLSEETRAIGAANTVLIEGGRLAGHNTDGAGWAWGLRRALPDADLSRVVLLGAGGAGSACADAVLRLGARELVVVDRDHERAEALARKLPRCSAERSPEKALRGATGLIHATPTGMAKLPGLPLPAGLLRPALWVSEVVYVPLETELVKAARAAGCAVMHGGHMNVGQAALGFRLFTGREADAARMEALFRAA